MTSSRCCVIGAGAAGLAALKVLRDARPRCGLLRADRPGRRPLAHRLRVAAPDHVRDVSGFAGLPDAGALPGVPEPRPDARLPGGLRRPSRPARAHHASAPRSSPCTPIGPRRRGRLARRDRRRGDAGRTTAYSSPTGTCGTRTSADVSAGRSPARPCTPSQYHNIGRHRGRPRARRRRRQLGLRPRRRRRQRPAGPHISIRQRADVPAEGDLRPAAGRAALARAAAAAWSRSGSTRALIDVVIGPRPATAGCPNRRPATSTEQPPVVNNLLLYWIQHGRITARARASRGFEGRTVHFADGTSARVRHRSCGPPASR